MDMEKSDMGLNLLRQVHIPISPGILGIYISAPFEKKVGCIVIGHVRPFVEKSTVDIYELRRSRKSDITKIWLKSRIVSNTK